MDRYPCDGPSYAEALLAIINCPGICRTHTPPPPLFYIPQICAPPPPPPPPCAPPEELWCPPPPEPEEDDEEQCCAPPCELPCPPPPCVDQPVDCGYDIIYRKPIRGPMGPPGTSATTIIPGTPGIDAAVGLTGPAAAPGPAGSTGAGGIGTFTIPAGLMLHQTSVNGFLTYTGPVNVTFDINIAPLSVANIIKVVTQTTSNQILPSNAFNPYSFGNGAGFYWTAGSAPNTMQLIFPLETVIWTPQSQVLAPLDFTTVGFTVFYFNY